jgi:hypothetical protein
MPTNAVFVRHLGQNRYFALALVVPSNTLAPVQRNVQRQFAFKKIESNVYPPHVVLRVRLLGINAIK